LPPPRDLSRRIERALNSEDFGLVEKLFKRYPDYKLPGHAIMGWGWLHLAADNNNVSALKYLLSAGWNVDETDTRNEHTAIDVAARAGHLSAVKCLLDAGASMDTRTSLANPLFGAISGSVHVNATFAPPTGEAPAIVRLLLERGIDATACYNTRSMVDMDAAAFAWMMGARDLAFLILDHIYGDDAWTKYWALLEAREVSFGNAGQRIEFRRWRYPPRPTRGRTGKVIQLNRD
jgi:hypothetical protein